MLCSHLLICLGHCPTDALVVFDAALYILRIGVLTYKKKWHRSYSVQETCMPSLGLFLIIDTELQSCSYRDVDQVIDYIISVMKNTGPFL